MRLARVLWALGPAHFGHALSCSGCFRSSATVHRSGTAAAVARPPTLARWGSGDGSHGQACHNMFVAATAVLITKITACGGLQRDARSQTCICNGGCKSCSHSSHCFKKKKAAHATLGPKSRPGRNTTLGPKSKIYKLRYKGLGY